MDITPQTQAPSQQHAHTWEVFVNSRPTTVDQDELTFEQIVALAFSPVPSGPGVTFTVSYRHAAQHPAEGTLVVGRSVEVKKGTAFNVTATDKS